MAQLMARSSTGVATRPAFKVRTRLYYCLRSVLMFDLIQIWTLVYRWDTWTRHDSGIVSD